jgi:hypothetical protein
MWIKKIHVVQLQVSGETMTNHLQNRFTTIRPKNYKKSLLCGLISQTSAEMPPKNGGVRKAN